MATPITAVSGASDTGAKVRDWALLLVCNFIWASQFAMVKLVQTEMGFVFATFLPMTIATLILIPFVVWQRHAHEPRPRQERSIRDIGHFVTLGVLGQIAAQLCVTWGTQLSTAANAALLFLSLPIVTTIMAFFLLGERMTLIRLLAFGLALLGVVESSGVQRADLRFAGVHNLLGNLLIFVSIAGSAFYNVYSKRMMQRYSPLEVLLYSYLAVFVFMLPVTLALEPQGFANLPRYSLGVWVGLMMLAVLQYALSMVIFLRVLSRIDATQAAVMNYLIPFLGVVIGWALLHEHMTGFMVVGGILALGSTLLATVFDRPQDLAVAPED